MGKVNTRNRNEGKFYKNGKKKPANWEYRFEAVPVNGKRQQISDAGYPTEKAAYEAGVAAYEKYNSAGSVNKPKEISVADYLDYWLENAIRKNLHIGYTYNTYSGYENIVRNHLKPAFGQYWLYALANSPHVVQQFIDGMKLKGFSRNMISNTLSCLSGAFNYAIQPLRYVQQNPCLYVKIGRMPKNTKSKEHKEYVLPQEEFQRILARFPEGTSSYLPLMVGYYLGTRISETYGIDLLHDLDLENNEIHITQQLTKEDHGWFFRPPKYESYRTVKFGDTLKQALQNELHQRKKNMIEYGPYYMKTYRLPDNSIVQYRADLSVPYQEIYPLVVQECGQLYTPDSFKYCARVVHYDLGNPLFHSHCLRHTHGTRLAENGVNPKTVMERLGHRDIKTTLQTYTFNTEVMQTAAVDIFESVAK